MNNQAKIPDKTTTDVNSSIYAEMSTWLKTPLGEAFLEAENLLLDDLLPRRFGYHLLQLGCANIAMYDNSPIGHKFSFSSDPLAIGQMAIASNEALPLASESVDLVLIHHALDMSQDKHQLLREASRVLIAGGHMIILGFTPFSGWGLRNKLQRTKKPPWHGKLLGPARIVDWLKLLEFQVNKVNYGLYTVPFNSPWLIKYSSVLGNLATRLNWPTGGIYAISAKKEVMPLTPIKEPWKKFAGKGLGLPVADNISRSSRDLNKQIHPESCNNKK